MKSKNKYSKKLQLGGYDEENELKAEAFVNEDEYGRRKLTGQNIIQGAQIVAPFAMYLLNQRKQQQPVQYGKYVTETTPVVQSYREQKQKEQNQENLIRTGISTGLSLVAPGAGTIYGIGTEALKQVGNSIAPKKNEYGIDYYENYGFKEGLTDTLDINKGIRDVFNKDENENTGEYFANMLTFNLYDKFSGRSKDENERKKQQALLLKNTENELNRIERDKQGIYAKDGVMYGNYKIKQITNIPKHKDNVVVDTIEAMSYPALEKGAGGAIIPFGKENQKVLIENGEYVIKDETNTTVAVLPEKLGRQVLNGKITLEQALKKIPNIKNAEKAKVLQDGGKERNISVIRNPILQDMVYGQNPLLTSILSQDAIKSKYVAKKGIVNTDGYLKTSKNKNNPVNIIPSNIITTENMAFPIYANGKKLYPDTGVYKFKNTDYVIETPVAKCGAMYGAYKIRKKGQTGLKDVVPYPYPNVSPDDPVDEYYDEKIPYSPNQGKGNYTSFGMNKQFYPTGNKSNLATMNKTSPYVYMGANNNFNKRPVPDIDWSDPDIANANTQEIVKKINTFIKNPSKEKMANTGRYVDPNTAFNYGLSLYQFWKAYNAKPSQRPLYEYDPKVKEVLDRLNYKRQYGDTKGYQQSLKNIEAERMRAMQQLTNTNTSSGSYLNTLSSLGANIANAQNDARNKFITEQQNYNEGQYNNWVATQHNQERKAEFQDKLLRNQELQAFHDNREKAMQEALRSLGQYLQDRKTSSIQQSIRDANYLNALQESQLEYYLMYGTDEEKAYAKKVMKDPYKYYYRPYAKNIGTFQPISRLKR